MGCGEVKTVPIDQLSDDPDHEWMACDRCEKWSHVTCIDIQFGIPDNWEDSQAPWKCPICNNESLWDDKLLV